MTAAKVNGDRYFMPGWLKAMLPTVLGMAVGGLMAFTSVKSDVRYEHVVNETQQKELDAHETKITLEQIQAFEQRQAIIERLTRVEEGVRFLVESQKRADGH